MAFTHAALFFLCLSAVVGCRNGQQPAPTSSAEFGTASVLVPAAGKVVTFRVEVARSLAEQKQGLMYRQQLAQDAGMLFVDDRAEVQQYWMKNVSIPLDMIFIDAQRAIIGIVENAEPLSLTPRGVSKPSKYVLEINGGLSARLGIRTGAVVEFRGLGQP